MPKQLYTPLTAGPLRGKPLTLEALAHQGKCHQNNRNGNYYIVIRISCHEVPSRRVKRSCHELPDRRIDFQENLEIEFADLVTDSRIREEYRQPLSKCRHVDDLCSTLALDHAVHGQ